MPPCPGTLKEVDGRFECSRGLSCLVEELAAPPQDVELLAGQIREFHKRRM